MRNTYEIEQYKIVQNQLHFSLNELDQEKQFVPAERVIVDSDGFSFIYIVEEGSQYSYLKFSQKIWPQLVELLKTEQDPFLQTGQDIIIELKNFVDELKYLLFNIEGNDNYGEDFVKAVESQFESILQMELE